LCEKALEKALEKEGEGRKVKERKVKERKVKEGEGR